MPKSRPVVPRVTPCPTGHPLRFSFSYANSPFPAPPEAGTVQVRSVDDTSDHPPWKIRVRHVPDSPPSPPPLPPVRPGPPPPTAPPHVTLPSPTTPPPTDVQIRRICTPVTVREITYDLDQLRKMASEIRLPYLYSGPKREINAVHLANVIDASRVQLSVRTDNIAALSMACNMQPHSSQMAIVARELALDIASSSCAPDDVFTFLA